MAGIGYAVEQMGMGKKLTREGWNGKDMYLKLQIPDFRSKMTLPYVYMFTAHCEVVPWLCSQSDLLAEDWLVLGEKKK